MKNLFLLLTFITIHIINYAQTDCTKKNLAEVPKYNGIYIFFMNEPAQPYELITTMKKRLPISTITEGFQKWTEAAKKEYPNCDAIIMRDVVISGFGADKLEVIKFK